VVARAALELEERRQRGGARLSDTHEFAGDEGGEVVREKKPGTKRILIIGDSIAFGTGVDAEWRFSDFLSRALGDDVEVINAGVCGWGTDQELLYYEKAGKDLDADIVILTFTMANDVLNNMLDHLFLARLQSRGSFSKTASSFSTSECSSPRTQASNAGSRTD